MASFRNKIMSVLDVALRVPPVFVVDSLFMNGIGGPITGTKLLQTHLYGQLLKSPPVLRSSIDQDFEDPSVGTNNNHDDISSNSSNSLFDQIFSSNNPEANIVFEGGRASVALNDYSSNMVWITCYFYCK